MTEPARCAFALEATDGASPCDGEPLWTIVYQDRRGYVTAREPVCRRHVTPQLSQGKRWGGSVRARVEPSLHWEADASE